MCARWIVPPAEGMIEPAVAPEFYTNQIGGIEALSDGMVRIYYCAEQLPLFGGDVVAQNVVVLKVIRPVESIARGFASMAQCLTAYENASGGGMPPASPFRPRLVR